MSFISTGKLNPKGDVITRSKLGRKRPSDLGLRLAQEWKNQNQLPELIYMRWGRKDCPETATLVYHGKEKIRLSTNSLAWVIAQVNFFVWIFVYRTEQPSALYELSKYTKWKLKFLWFLLSSRFKEEFSRFICRLLGRQSFRFTFRVSLKRFHARLEFRAKCCFTTGAEHHREESASMFCMSRNTTEVADDDSGLEGVSVRLDSGVSWLPVISA